MKLSDRINNLTSPKNLIVLALVLSIMPLGMIFTFISSAIDVGIRNVPILLYICLILSVYMLIKLSIKVNKLFKTRNK